MKGSKSKGSRPKGSSSKGNIPSVVPEAFQAALLAALEKYPTILLNEEQVRLLPPDWIINAKAPPQKITTDLATLAHGVCPPNYTEVISYIWVSVANRASAGGGSPTVSGYWVAIVSCKPIGTSNYQLPGVITRYAEPPTGGGKSRPSKRPQRKGGRRSTRVR